MSGTHASALTTCTIEFMTSCEKKKKTNLKIAIVVEMEGKHYYKVCYGISVLLYIVQAVQCTDRAKSLPYRDQLVLPMEQKSVETCSTSSQMPVQELSSDLKHSHIVHGAYIQ